MAKKYSKNSNSNNSIYRWTGADEAEHDRDRDRLLDYNRGLHDAWSNLSVGDEVFYTAGDETITYVILDIRREGGIYYYGGINIDAENARDEWEWSCRDGLKRTGRHFDLIRVGMQQIRSGEGKAYDD
jgi:hypothetical protein